ncbi:EAL domain-containing protein [Peribacillus saganii]|uniref:EAL domain-containing protein n=1 Tax=Peribacillus saganii TaxID=2303992 RepID=A0A372LNX1_9BACI|nr:EAL domain-containing protein [Peribacillus saganii]RFU69439.1 EAL domain-containing protein [Peribacillus saganii]
MKLKFKTIFVVGITMTLLIIILLSLLSPMLLQEAANLDKDQTVQELERVNNNIHSNMDELRMINRDWAIWDETYSFIVDRNQVYIDSSLENTTFENIQLNFICFINNQNKLVYQKGYDLENHQPLQLQTDFYNVFLPILHNKDSFSEKNLVSTKHGLAMFSLESIYRSNGQGPPTGTLVMGRLFGENVIKEVEKELSIDLTFKPNENINNKELLMVENLNETKLKGSLLLIDYAKKNAYEISFVKARSFYIQKKNSVNHITFYLITVSLFSMLLIIFLLNRFLLTRVSNLSMELKQIQTQKDIRARISGSKNNKDELTILENSINETLASLEDKHNEVRNLAYYDQLTFLPNRYMFFQEFTKRIQNNNGEIIILFLDLDGFKRVNDSLGHELGDTLLKEVSNRILPIVEGYGGMIARYGGDEFLVLLNYKERHVLEMIIQNILMEIQKEYRISNFKTFVTGSVGIGVFPHDGCTLEEVLKSADIAMYEAKRKGKNQYCFFSELTGNNEYKLLMELEKDLKNVVQNRELELYYQPIVCSKDEEIVGVEVLLRWNHPAKGIIFPNKFIPIAEESGLMPVIGYWVLEEAIKQGFEWKQKGFNKLILSVNISMSQMKDHSFIEVLDNVLSNHLLSPAMLQLEIRESDIGFDLKEVREFINEIKKRNIKIALDDFGAEASSLLSLKELPIDVVKIDQNFIKNITAKPLDQILLNGIFEITKGLHLDVIVEGIENKEQLKYISSCINTKLQGFYFSPPLPAPDFEKDILGMDMFKTEQEIACMSVKME